MDIDTDLIKKVAKNARLHLSEKEAEGYVDDFKNILNAFSTLDEASTENTKPSFQPVELAETMRDDKTGECLSQEDALSNATHKKDGYFKGPKAI